MNITAMAARHHVSKSAIRYYEKQGLLGPIKRISGQRQFTSNDDARLALIRLSLSAGFSLKEIHSLIQYTEQVSPAGNWRKFVDQKRQEMKSRIEECERMMGVLDQLDECHCESLERCGEEFMTGDKVQRRSTS